jgi:hypothetical protein
MAPHERFERIAFARSRAPNERRRVHRATLPIIRGNREARAAGHRGPDRDRA